MVFISACTIGTRCSGVNLSLLRIIWIYLQMHEDPEAQPMLAEGQIDRFVRIEDQDYDAIREMARKAEQVTW